MCTRGVNTGTAPLRVERARLLQQWEHCRQKGSFFCFLSAPAHFQRKKGRTFYEQRNLAADRGRAAVRPAQRPRRPHRPGGGPAAGAVRPQRTAGGRQEEHRPDLLRAVPGFPGHHPHRRRRGLRRPGGRGEHGGHPGGHHHERRPGYRPDCEGRGLPGQPETDVRPHGQGPPGRRGPPDPRPGISSSWKPATPSAPTAACWSAPA